MRMESTQSMSNIVTLACVNMELFFKVSHVERPKTRQFVNPGFKTRPRGKPGFGFGFRVCSKPWFLLLDICSQENVVKKCFAIAFPPKKCNLCQSKMQ